MTKPPDMSEVKWSPAQQAHRKRFKQASAYAKAAMANPKIRAIYEKKAVKVSKCRGIWRSLITSKGKICFPRNNAEQMRYQPKLINI